MSEREPNGTISYRLSLIDRRLDYLYGLEPAVMKNEIAAVKDDIHQIAKDLAGVRSLLIKFFIGATLTLVSGVIYVVVSTGTHP